jgi:hypothetical protein
MNMNRAILNRAKCTSYGNENCVSIGGNRSPCFEIRKTVRQGSASYQIPSHTTENAELETLRAK